ncbi:YiiX/YebB-like N1pC/P60 family cysteine hydrolase [Brevibacillus agri]|uniref:YiiX/YebB-like N1pC/P60 family cysteine hydrolase n=2 Tax=Brevibacillus agri TaxID=51101 RepID=UPI003D2277F3
MKLQKLIILPIAAAILLAPALSFAKEDKHPKISYTKEQLDYIEKIKKNDAFTLANWNKIKKFDARKVEKIEKLKGINKNSDQKKAMLSTSGSVGTYGDILVSPAVNKVDHLYVGHAAIVYDESYTIEAWPDGGVKKMPNNWANRYSKLKGLYVSGAEGTHYKAARSYANYQIGDEYNWAFFDKRKENQFYCSQLVWRAWYNQGFKIGNGTDELNFPVTPNDLINDSDTVEFYSKG